ncbi:MAG: DUF2752 domain-containing protein [Lachnospiraceae bacterium]
MNHLRRIWSRVFADVKRYYVPVLMITAYLFVFTVVFKKAVCPLFLTLGLPCPSCGMTRAFLLLLQGEFSAAWAMHPFIYAVILLALIAAVYRWGLGKDIRGLKYVVVVLVLLLIAFYIYRMITVFPRQQPMVFNRESLGGLLAVILKR